MGTKDCETFEGCDRHRYAPQALSHVCFTRFSLSLCLHPSLSLFLNLSISIHLFFSPIKANSLRALIKPAWSNQLHQTSYKCVPLLNTCSSLLVIVGWAMVMLRSPLYLQGLSLGDRAVLRYLTVNYYSPCLFQKLSSSLTLFFTQHSSTSWLGVWRWWRRGEGEHTNTLTFIPLLFMPLSLSFWDPCC